MPAITAATAIIRFSGIILFSTQLSTDGHLQAIAPRIPPRVTGIKHVIDEDRPTIDPHAAYIRFRASDFVSSKGWISPPASKAGYVTVKLDGERIEIVADLPQVIDTNHAQLSLMRQSTASSPDPLLLPHLRNADALKDEYREKTGFSGAVAVFDLPQGTPAGCKYIQQVDTQLMIPNNGRIKIHATKPVDKTIVLKGGAEVRITHSPLLHKANSLPHLQAYRDMSTSPLKAQVSAADPPFCPDSPTNGHVAGDFQCSNSQWP